MFVDNNAGRLQGWLDSIAEGVKDPDTGEFLIQPNPEKAFTLFQSVVEYHVPKLARTEHAGNVTVSHIDALRAVERGD